MNIFLIILLVVLGAALFFYLRHRRLAKSTIKDTHVGLSEAGRRIMRVYLDLPENSRPNIGLRSTLVSLDEKFEKENVDKHFTETHRSYMGDVTKMFNWHHHEPVEFGCGGKYRGHQCQYSTYITLYNEIIGIKTALDERDKKMREAEFNQRGLDAEDIKSITERLREERTIIQEVTKEIL